MPNYTIPLRHIPVVDKTGIVSLPWYQFFQSLIPGEGYPESAISVGASPFAYTAPDDGFIVIVGGTVSGVTLDRAKGAHAVQTSGAIPVGKGDVITVIYSSAPAMYIYPQ